MSSCCNPELSIQAALRSAHRVLETNVLVHRRRERSRAPASPLCWLYSAIKVDEDVIWHLTWLDDMQRSFSHLPSLSHSSDKLELTLVWNGSQRRGVESHQSEVGRYCRNSERDSRVGRLGGIDDGLRT